MPRPIVSAVAAFLGVIVMAASTPGHASDQGVRGVRAASPEPAGPNLFRPLPGGKTPPGDLEPWEIRRRVVAVDWTLLRPLCDPNIEGVGGRLTLNLFPTVDVIAEPDNSGTTFRRDSVRWRGDAAGTPDSSITLTAIGLCDDSPARVALSGSIKLNGEEYTIEPRPNGRVAITEINSVAAGLVQKPDHREDLSAEQPDPGAERVVPPPSRGPVVIDALMLYTPGAVEQAGGVDEIVSWIEDAVARSNDNLAKSDVNASFRVVHMEEAKGYKGGETVQPAFDHLDNQRDGVLDDASRLRDKYGADIVTTIVKGYDPKNPVAGLASYPENPKNPATSEQVWSVVAANQLWAYVLAHEWGHLLGLDHDWKTSPERNRFYPDNHGFVAPDGSFVTIMGYPSACRTPCPYADFYANPKLSYDGQRLGVPIGGRSAADNTRVMNLTAPQVAAYRAPKVAPASFDLAITADPPLGGITESEVAGPYAPGDLVTVTAVASPGYRFTGWTLDGKTPAELGDTLHIRMKSDRRLVAHFAKGSGPQSRVMAAATPDGGGRVVLKAAGPDTDPVPQVLATAVPARGFTFTGWLLDGKAAGDDPQFTIDVADGHHMVTARFAREQRRRSIKVTVVPAAGGRVSISGSGPSASGSDIVARAVPARGHTFARWELGGRPYGDDPVAALTVRGGEHLTAIFKSPVKRPPVKAKKPPKKKPLPKKKPKKKVKRRGR